MTDISIDVSGIPGLKEELNDLKDKYAEEPVYAVGTNVEYAVFWRWVRGICRRTRFFAQR